MKICIEKSDLKSLGSWSYHDTGGPHTRSGGVHTCSVVVCSIGTNSNFSGVSIGISRETVTTNNTPFCTFVNESNKDPPIGAHVEHCSVSIGGCANAGDTGSTIPGHCQSKR